MENKTAEIITTQPKGAFERALHMMPFFIILFLVRYLTRKFM